MKFLHDNFHPNKDEPVVLCSHYDLDGVGSTYFAKLIFNVKKHFCSGYPKVIGNVEKAIGMADTIVFVDLDVPPDALKLALKNFKTVYYCDHHPGSEQYKRIQEAMPDKFRFLFDPKLAATKILAMKAAMLGYELSPAEIKFANACDAYDVWRIESDKFMAGYHLNTIFWLKNFWGFESYLSELYDKDDYIPAFPDEVWQEAYDKYEETVAYVQDLDNFELIETDNFKASFYIFPKGLFYVNDVLMNNPSHSVVIGTEVGKATASIRMNIDGYDLNEVLAEVKKKNLHILDGSGHAFAAGITMAKEVNVNELDDLLDMVYDIIEEIDGGFI